MSNIVSVKQKIQVEGTVLRSPVSESLEQTIGGSINYLIDTTDNHETRITTAEANIAALQAATHLKNSVGSTSIGAGATVTVFTSPSGPILTGHAKGGSAPLAFGGDNTATTISGISGAISSGIAFTVFIVGNDLRITNNGGTIATFYWSAFYNG